MPQPNAAKAALRRAVLSRRDALSPEARAVLDRRITQHLLLQPALAKARSVLAYLSFGSEFDTFPLVTELLARGVRLALPRVDRQAWRLELYVVQDVVADTAAGTWGIREPLPGHCAVADPQTLDVVLAPGVAFTRNGERLGYGGGFYDKLLATWQPRPPVIAAGYDVQMVEALPVDADDVPVDVVVTETGAFIRPT